MERKIQGIILKKVGNMWIKRKLDKKKEKSAVKGQLYILLFLNIIYSAKY